MKKIIALFCVLFVMNYGVSQNDQELFKFDKKYYEAVDKWVTYPKKEKDSTYTLGFIYIDEQAGFTMNYKTDFIVTSNGLKDEATIGKNISMKVRIEPNSSNVAILTPEQVKELGLPEQPDWLKIYKEDAAEASYLTKIGYHYNHVGACNLALIPLLKAYEKEPHFEGLEFELAYAYNALKQFNKAIPVLKKAIENDSKNYFFFRELGYSYKNLNRVVDAEAIYKKGISLSEDDFEKSEMAVNMAQTYFQLKNKKKFDEWAKLTRKFAEEDSRYAKFIDYFESNWDKK